MEKQGQENNGYLSDAEAKNYGTIVEPSKPTNETSNKNKENNKKEKRKVVSAFQIFRYATKWDCFMMFLGTLGSIGNGASFPLMNLFFTNIIDTFTDYGSLSTCNLSNQTFDFNGTIPFDLNGKLREQSIYLIILALASMVLCYFQVSFWLMPAERQARKIRKKLFSSILRQEIGWFDTYKSGELTNRLTDDINKIKEGIGDKFSNAIQFMSTFVCGVAIGFIRGWKLTLVILSLSPILIFCSVAFTKIVESLTKNELKSYASAGAVAEEVFSAIRTVFAFNGSQKEHQRYVNKLENARRSGIKKGLIQGFLFGIVWLVINGAYALGFWYGWTLTEVDPLTGKAEFTVGGILLVFFSIIIGVFSLGNAAPFISTFASSRGAAYEVFNIIDRKPLIDSKSDSGEKLDQIKGYIEFKDVSFNYPSRPEIQVLNSINLNIQAGQTVALVGSSGCGKSTCIQLLQRFYDPKNGSITIDNHDLKNLNLNWLRSQIGVVNQEPILFATSIIENIRYGREDVSDNEIIEAARSANAHDFVMMLPEKYETLVGDRGSQLSGGQKQRIAIARALVRNPKILLLDEATSALDNESESMVQAALDQARLGRTTIIVAHRLSTIRNADLIFAMDKGQVVEFGTHEDLMRNKGVYYSLVINQEAPVGGDDDDDDDNEESDKKINCLKSIELDKPNQPDQSSLSQTENKNEKKKKDKVPEPNLLRVLALNKPEWHFIVLGCIASIVTGSVQPLFSIIFSKVISVFQKCNFEDQRDDIYFYVLMFVAIGVVSFFSNFIMGLMFSISGENMTKRIRSECFKTYLKQDVSYFDKPENNVGTLTTRLAVEAAAVQGATGVRIGGILMNIGNFGVGLVLAFIYGWAITLLIIAFVPFMIISGILQTKLITGFASKDKEILEEAGKISNEAVGNIRTVAILNKEDYFSNAYSRKIDIPYKAAIKSANVYGFMLGFTNSIMFYAIAAAFAFGGYLIEKQLFGLNFERIMIVFSCVIFGASSVGQAASLMPDYAKAKIAIIKIFELFDRVTKIDNWSKEGGIIPDETTFDQSIKFESVQFTYPNRAEVTVLNKINLTINKGQQVALVGSSGCGKSTITQLLERFYDVDSGSITLGDCQLKDINLNWLRSQIGIVSQEPILFDATIAENIAYGDNSREVTMNEIVDAAKQANIHDFIISLPIGYDTNVGSKGTQLSGGQKQRVSIARAIIRNPKILLLDEATSALDTESEKIVQEALEKAQKGRTCIVIAHRLSTIRNSDVIFVIKNGQIIEAGSHDQLMELNGFYAKLNKKRKS